jgi:hypothetical protein
MSTSWAWQLQALSGYAQCGRILYIFMVQLSLQAPWLQLMHSAITVHIRISVKAHRDGLWYGRRDSRCDW